MGSFRCRVLEDRSLGQDLLFLSVELGLGERARIEKAFELADLGVGVGGRWGRGRLGGWGRAPAWGGGLFFGRSVHPRRCRHDERQPPPHPASPLAARSSKHREPSSYRTSTTKERNPPIPPAHRPHQVRSRPQRSPRACRLSQQRRGLASRRKATRPGQLVDKRSAGRSAGSWSRRCISPALLGLAMRTPSPLEHVPVAKNVGLRKPGSMGDPDGPTPSSQLVG